jgi:biotin synthase
MLSRVTWPRRDIKKVFSALAANSSEFKRICLQAVNYPGVVDDLCELLIQIKNICDLPISVSCQPLGKEDIKRLARAGAERVSVALDAASPEVFERVKGSEAGGPYSWRGHLRALEHAHEVFGDRVSTHLIVGLGETEREFCQTIQLLHDMGVTIALFAFTPILGTPLADRPQPSVTSYRKIQLAHYLITQGISNAWRMKFEGGRIADFGVSRESLCTAVNSGKPFMTSGCPGCNRPFYNESPRGPIYNYPKKPRRKQIAVIRDQLGLPDLMPFK